MLTSDSDSMAKDDKSQSRSVGIVGEPIAAKRVSISSGYRLDEDGSGKVIKIRSKVQSLPTHCELDEHEYHKSGTLKMQLYVNHERIQLNSAQKQQIMQLIQAPAPSAAVTPQKIKNNKLPNNEDGSIQIKTNKYPSDDVFIEFNTKDTLLSSIIAPETVHKVASILFHRMHIIFILLLVIFGIYLVEYQYNTMLRIIYGYMVCSWFSIIGIVVISYINSRALRHILSQFEFWIKLCYGIRFVACIATYFVLNQDTERYKLLSAGIAVPLGLSVTLGVVFLGVFDGFYWIQKKNYIAMICLVAASAVCLCYYAIYFELFISEEERNESRIAIGPNHTIYIDLVSNIANSSELLVLFVVKHCYYMIRIITSHDSQRAIAIRVVPILRWIGNDATSCCPTLRNSIRNSAHK